MEGFASVRLLREKSSAFSLLSFSFFLPFFLILVFVSFSMSRKESRAFRGQTGIPLIN